MWSLDYRSQAFGWIRGFNWGCWALFECWVSLPSRSWKNQLGWSYIPLDVKWGNFYLFKNHIHFCRFFFSKINFVLFSLHFRIKWLPKNCLRVSKNLLQIRSKWITWSVPELRPNFIEEKFKAVLHHFCFLFLSTIKIIKKPKMYYLSNKILIG